MTISMNEKLSDIWESDSGSCCITEDYLSEGIKSEVDGQIILGKIVGPAFFGDGISRNQRFYPRAVWEKQLSKQEIKERLANRTMLGCIGHDDGPVTENDISQGKISHIVTKMVLQENNQGIAEMLILNTQAGRNLYTLMKAGSKLKVSTRAQGQFMEGKTHNGLPMVDPDTFILETIDFVLAPGFLETNPQLQESLKKVSEKVDKLTGSINNESSTVQEIKEKNMNEEFIKESMNVYKDLYQKVLKENDEMKAEVAKMEKEAEAKEEEIKECKSKLAKYESLGTAESLARDIQEYAELGINSPIELSYVLETLKEEAEKEEDVEELEDIKKDLEEAYNKLAKYEELGEPEELADTKDKAEELVDELEKKEIEESVIRLSRKYKCSEALVRKIVEASEDEEEAEEIIKAEKEEEDDEDDEAKKDQLRRCKRDKKDKFRFSNRQYRRDRLEGGLDDSVNGTRELEDNHNFGDMNNNDVEDPAGNVVKENYDSILETLLAESKSANDFSIGESYKPANIVSNMFKNL